MPSGPRADARLQTDEHLGQVVEGGVMGWLGGSRLGPGEVQRGRRKQRDERYFHVGSTGGASVKDSAHCIFLKKR